MFGVTLNKNKKAAGDLESQIAKLKRSISAMTSKTSNDDDKDSDDSDVPYNAGDAFGAGRQKKSQILSSTGNFQRKIYKMCR